MTTTDSTTGRASPAVALRITPLSLLGGRSAARVLERNILVYRRSWIFIISGFFEPLFYLLSIGIGLNRLCGPRPAGLLGHERGHVGLHLLGVHEAEDRQDL